MPQGQNCVDRIFSEPARIAITEPADRIAPTQTLRIDGGDEGYSQSSVGVVLPGWSAPKLDEAFLIRCPHLSAFCYGAGFIRIMVMNAFWQWKILICSVVMAKAVPVAEYAHSQVLFLLKSDW
jgi:phosphoglycerate dehydrogenase-like enzyme